MKFIFCQSKAAVINIFICNILHFDLKKYNQCCLSIPFCALKVSLHFPFVHMISDKKSPEIIIFVLLNLMHLYSPVISRFSVFTFRKLSTIERPLRSVFFIFFPYFPPGAMSALENSIYLSFTKQRGGFFVLKGNSIIEPSCPVIPEEFENT